VITPLGAVAAHLTVILNAFRRPSFDPRRGEDAASLWYFLLKVRVLRAELVRLLWGAEHWAGFWYLEARESNPREKA
jgi:hypothetical protein